MKKEIEVRTNFFDEYSNVWCVDVWFKDSEEGIVAARINPETLEVTFDEERLSSHNLGKKNPLIHNAIKEKLREIINATSDESKYSVYVGDVEVNDFLIRYDEARQLAKEWKEKGYVDVYICKYD